jgi:hypothetical protein
MPQEFQHYQTSFGIVSDGIPEKDVFNQLQSLAFKWVIDKENKRRKQSGREDYGMQIPPKEFFLKGSARSKRSQFVSETGYFESGRAWVLEYGHVDRDIRGLSWTTRIGLHQFTGEKRVVVSVLVAYRVSTDLALADNLPVPMPTVPRFIRDVFMAFQSCKISCGGGEIDPGTLFQSLDTEEAVKKAADFIADPARRISVVLIVGKSMDAEAEARRLGFDLQGKSLVFIVPCDHQLLQPLACYRVGFRQCRILLPFARFGTRLSAHVSYSLDNPDRARTVRERAVRAQLAHCTVVEPGAVATLADLRNMIHGEKFFRLRKELEGKKAELAENGEWQEFANGAMQQYEAENRKNGELAAQIEDLQMRCLELEEEKEDLAKEKNAEIFNLRATHEAKGRQSAEEGIRLPVEFPDSMEGLKAWALTAGVFPHLGFNDGAWEPALTYEQFEDFGNLWRILWHLDNTLFRMKYVDKVANLEKAFEDKTGLRYSRSEGSKTRKDAKLAALRRFEFEGKVYEMWTHVGLGTKEPHLIRVYFDFDDDTRRIIIGFIGSHMDNATTKNLH